jgi:hypothetical protein
VIALTAAVGLAILVLDELDTLRSITIGMVAGAIAFVCICGWAIIEVRCWR